jgi:hypothetical protein
MPPVGAGGVDHGGRAVEADRVGRAAPAPTRLGGLTGSGAARTLGGSQAIPLGPPLRTNAAGGPPRVTHRRAIAPFAAALAALALAAPALAAGAGVIKPWGLQNEGGDRDVPLEQALVDARSNDLLTAHVQAYAGDVAAMRRANRDLLILAYMNAGFSQFWQSKHFPEDWYAHDRTGARVRNRVTGNYLMVPTNEGWVQNRIEECRLRLAASGYHGCDLDMLGQASLSTGYVTGVAMNPATGREFTRAEWLAATAELAARVRAAVTPKLVMGNGLSTGTLYFGGTRQLLAGMDGGIAEAWMRGSKLAVDGFHDAATWKKDVDLIVDAEAQGKPILTLTKLWVRSTQAQKDQWRTYSLASFLLATNGRSYFFFSDRFGASRTASHPLYTLDIGTPLGPYANRDGVYTRNFSAGRVLVNPSRRIRTVALGGTYLTPTGNRVTTVKMGPNTGKILRRAG